MSFIDQVQSTAKTVGDKISSSVEIAKLKNRMSTERRSIDAQYIAIGEYVCDRAAKGDDFDPTVKELIANINAHRRELRRLQAQIDAISERDLF